MLLQSLKFVRGVIKKNRITPELEHYQIKEGRVTGFNGHMALSAPVDLDFEAYPNADMFSRAVEACTDQEKTAMYLTQAGRLAVKSGGFRAYVPCLDQVFYDAVPTGEIYEAPTGLLKDLETLAPFIAEDASRPWAMGLLMADGILMATNNVIFVQKWSGHQLPRMNLPRFAVQELIRIGKSPSHIQTDGHSVSFLYEDGRWMRTQLYSDDWPFDKMNSIMEAEHDCEDIPKGFQDAVEQIYPFTESKAAPVYFDGGGLATSTADEDGVFVECEGIPDGPIFSVGQLRMLATVGTKIDWSMFPAPCIFYGEGLRGAMVGRNY